MFTSKELRGNNSMLGRVQRQQDCSYKEKLNSFNSVSNLSLDNESGFKSLLKDKKFNITMEKATMKEPVRTITKLELGNKRRLLR
jgi:hypothetical protein